MLGLDSLYVSRHPGAWNWRHPDLLMSEWFREEGHRIDFDVLHLVEWDLLLLAPLDRLYAHVPGGSVALTCLTPTARLEGRWEWLDDPDRRREWELLQDHARHHWGPVAETRACLGPGPALPRDFVATYAALDVPPLGHDELRLPLAATTLGFATVDTGFRADWFASREAEPGFYVAPDAVPAEVIDAERRRPGGRRAFHPVRHRIVMNRSSTS
jgi:hypothetical protein